MPDNNAGVHYIRYVPASYAQIHAYDYDNDYYVSKISAKKEQPAKKTEKANSPKKDSATSKLQHDMKPNRKKQKSQSHNGKSIEKHSSGLTSSFGSLPQFQQLLAEMSYPD